MKFKIFKLRLQINCLCAFGLLFFSQLLDDRICNLNRVYLLLHHGVEVQIADQLLLEGHFVVAFVRATTRQAALGRGPLLMLLDRLERAISPQLFAVI